MTDNNDTSYDLMEYMAQVTVDACNQIQQQLAQHAIDHDDSSTALAAGAALAVVIMEDLIARNLEEDDAAVEELIGDARAFVDEDFSSSEQTILGTDPMTGRLLVVDDDEPN